MLRSLHIENYVLIDSLDVDFPEGLVIITGQTGAGKSILLGALSLLLGGKADASHISSGADSCVVEGEFSISPDPAFKALLDESDVDIDGDGTLTVRRVVTRSGRARSFINDCPVQSSTLAAFSPFLVNIHSQHSSLLLADKRYQLSVLDDFAGNEKYLEACAFSWRKLQNLKSSLKDAVARRAAASAEGDYNSSQYRQLQSAMLRDGELDELEAEQVQLANAEMISENLNRASNCLQGDEAGVPSLLKEASKLLSQISSWVPDMSELSSRLDSSRIEIEDILSGIDSAASSSVCSPERLNQVEERLGLLYSLMKRHGCQSEAELIAVRDKLGAELTDTESLAELVSELESKVEAASKAYDADCDALTGRRKEAAPALASAVSDNLKYLELDKAVFDVNVCRGESGPRGRDAVSFTFSSTGLAPVDVSKCASGGEISRIMLCLKVASSASASLPVMVFDEIDTGVSGSVADKMGSMICSLGGHTQVVAITHLPQVAAKGEAHYLVSKTSADDGTVRSSVSRLTTGERVMELARMLSGASITPEAVANARALIDAD